MSIQTQLYLPIEGVKLPIIPEVSLRGNKLFEAQLHAQENSLTILFSRDINRVARAVRPEKPEKCFITYARERTTLTDKDVADAYGRLHEQIWKNYWVRAGEVLVWKSSEAHPRNISSESPDKVTSTLISDYRVVDGRNEDYAIDTTGIEPEPHIKIDWPKKDGTITPEMAKLFGAEDNTYVWTNADPRWHEGLRSLVWGFGDRECPVLISNWHPWYGNPNRGYLLGRKQ